jgi:hypothetical protein
MAEWLLEEFFHGRDQQVQAQRNRVAVKKIPRSSGLCKRIVAFAGFVGC